MSDSDRRYKYPRTPHLPWSPGVSEDDILLMEVSPALRGSEIIVTEKLDGECTTLYPNGLHARSIDGRHHPSRNWVKALQGQIGHLIPGGWRVCGENVYARHSLGYDNLESYFYVFSIWDETNTCLSWEDTVEWAALLGLVTVPELYRGPWSEEFLRGISVDPETSEGYVVRSARGFVFSEFTTHIAKWVRKGHVTTEEHWMFAEITPNKLRLKV